MKSKEVEFTGWAPDMRAREATQHIKNLIPQGPAEYRAVRLIEPFTVALSARPYGLHSAESYSGEVSTIACTLGNIFALSAGAWSNRSRGGGPYLTDKWWNITVWQNAFFLANKADYIQTLTLPATGSTAADLTTDLKARYLAVVKDSFLFAGDTWDATDGERPQRVRWCAANDPTEWTVGTNLADLQDLKGEGGAVTGIVGGEHATILRERAWHRFTFTNNPDLVFQNDQIEHNIGTESPRSIVKEGSSIYFLANDGFRVIRHSRVSEAIGEGFVDEFFNLDAHPDFLQDVQGERAGSSNLIAWFYASTNAVDGIPDSCIIYNSNAHRWGHFQQLIAMPGITATSASTLEELDTLYPADNGTGGVEIIPGSLDDAIWTGGKFASSAFNGDYRLGTFTGAQLPVEIDTPEFGGMARKVRSRFLYPRAEGTRIQVNIGSRDKKNAVVQWGANREVPNARIGYGRHARYMRFRLLVDNPRDLNGCDLEYTDGAKR